MSSAETPPLAAVVFDLDGTLVETAPDLCAALNHVLEAERRPPLAVEEVRTLVGEGARKLIERGLSASGPVPTAAEIEARLPAFLDYYADHVADRSVPYPGVPETLAGLRDRGLSLGICTNKPYRLTKLLLAALDLDGWFGAVLGGDSLAIRKPDGGHLLAVIEALGVAAAEAAMVGDSGIDVACARDAGVPVIAVAYGYTQVAAEDLGADRLIARFADLPEALARLPRRPAAPA